MSVLLRRPATVPALFSPALEADQPEPPPPAVWERLGSNAPLLAVMGWAAVMLIDVPLVKAATAVARIVLPG